uniref:Transthyretin-like family protein n=1 Tax=Heligmosomoides polygyrus TaxID=6339 RepID=A0A183FUQ7_HELPZ
LAETSTDSSGYFYIEGHKKEISNIDPKVNIYHRCYYVGVGYQKVSFDVPSNFTVRGRKPEKTFDLGTIDLAPKLKGQ